MSKAPKVRVNLYMNAEILEVVDAFAAMNQRSRTFIIEELLTPSLPALKELLLFSEKLHGMSDAERSAAILRLDDMGDKLKGAVKAAPGHIKKISNDY